MWACARALLVALSISSCGGATGGTAMPDPVAGVSTGSAMPPSEPTAASAPGGLGGDMQSLLDAHNRDRAEHCAPPLTWSTEVAKTAQAWADRLASRGCGLEHSQTNLGENLAAGTPGTIDGQRAVDIWYAEGQGYDFANGGFSMKTGHFTQVVWKGSKSLGCGTATCKDMQVWVCNYDPAGNVEGEYRQNVLPATCRK